MKIKGKRITFLLTLSLCLWLGYFNIQAQDVKINLDESTYGIAEQKLNMVARVLIDENLTTLKSKSLRVIANVKALSEDYERGVLNYEMTTFFLHKNSYTAEVKRVFFSLVNGEKANVKIINEPLNRISIIKKMPIRLSCKLKQGIIIKPTGILELMKEKPLIHKRIETPKPMTRMGVVDLNRSVIDLQKAELALIKWWYAKGLSTTPCDYIPTAVSGSQDVYNTFSIAFGKGNAALRLGKTCTVKEVCNFLKYDTKLLAWNHIGHGWPGGIVLWDAALDAAIIQGLNPHRGIYCAVALINSCNTFNDPLKAAFLSNNPRTFIAGAISLPIGPSEKVDMCFWKDVLLNKKKMSVALNTCSTAQGLAGAFGLAGDGGFFW